MHIIVIYGGKSGEHEVSLVSASSVIRNIDLKQHSIELIGLTKNGQWFYQDKITYSNVLTDKNAVLTISEKPENLVSVIPGYKQNAFQCFSKFSQTNFIIPCDIVFPVLHGTFGEDGTIQGLFEMAEVPYVGCSVLSSSVGMDKEKTKQVWLHSQLPVVPFICIRKRSTLDKQKLDSLLSKAENSFSYPLFVKPCCAGSSVGASKAKNRLELDSALAEAFKWDNKILIEPAVNASEIECSVTGNSVISRDVCAYIPGEILPSHEFYDYDAKYLDPNGASLRIPAKLDDLQIEQVRTIAIKAYKALDCSGFARIDFFIDKNTNKLMLNEINTIPGFTSISMFPKMCEAAGLLYPQIIQLLLDQGISTFNSRRILQTAR